MQDSGKQINVAKEIDFFDGKKNFDDLITHYHEMNWKRMVVCPCKKEETTQAESDCINCNGIGMIWIDEGTIQGMLTSMSARKNFIQWTEDVQGMAYLSTVAENKLGMRDKITVKDGVSVYSQGLQCKVKSYNGSNVNMFYLKYDMIEPIYILGYVDVGTVYRELVLGTDINLVQGSKNKLYCNDEFDRISILYKYNTQYLVMDIINEWRMFKKTQVAIESVLGTEPGSIKEDYPLKVVLKKTHLLI